VRGGASPSAGQKKGGKSDAMTRASYGGGGREDRLTESYYYRPDEKVGRVTLVHRIICSPSAT